MREHPEQTSHQNIEDDVDTHLEKSHDPLLLQAIQKAMIETVKPRKQEIFMKRIVGELSLENIASQYNISGTRVEHICKEVVQKIHKHLIHQFPAGSGARKDIEDLLTPFLTPAKTLRNRH